MKKNLTLQSHSFLKTALWLCAALAALPLWADTVIVESRSGGLNFAKYSEDGGGFPNAWANSTAKSTAAGVTAGIGSRFNSNAGVGGAVTWFQVNPTLGTAGGTYDVYVTVGASSAGAAVTSTITQTGCTGLPATTTAFSVGSLNVWTLVGTITLDPGVNNPTIRFDETANDNRFYADAVRFVLAGTPCLAVPQLSTVNGPLAAGQTFVDVPAVAAGVTNVTVYNTTGSKLGELTTGVVAGVNRVTTSALVKNHQIIATQWKDGIESCKSTSGPKVGGGANPSIKVVFNIRKDITLTGPIGADGGTGGTANFFLGSANKTGGFGSSPSAGTVLTPSTCWQTVTLQRGDDPVNPINPTYRWDVTTADTLDGDYGILDSIGFAIQDTTDTGPFRIYIDDIKNGDTVIQDFESATAGQTAVTLSLPSLNTAANTAANLLSAAPGTITPNLSVVVDTNAASGTKSCLVSWQFNNSLNTTWEQLVIRGSGTPNPVVDLRLPISVHLLVLPVGSTTGHFLGDASVNSVTNCSGANATFTATVVGGTGPFTYQWKRNGANIAGATAVTFTTNGATSASSGTYSCLIGDGSGCTATPAGFLSIPAEVVIDSQPMDNGPVAGDGSGFASFSVGASIPGACPCANSPELTYQWKLNGLPIAGATDATYTLNNVYMTNGGTYTVLVSNTCNHVTLLSAAAKLYVYDPAVTPITASCSVSPGLLGLYWTNQTSATAFTGTTTWTNIDPNVDFDWGVGGPAFDIYAPTNNFTVRWVGTVQPYYPNQTYTFYTKSDDGVRLWVNGQLLIDKFVAQSATEWSGAIALGSGPANLVLEYFEQTSAASVQLSYESLSVNKQIIPSSQLCAADANSEIPPLIKLTLPANNATITLGNPLTLTASVTPSSGTVNKVEFYNHGTNLLDTVNAPGPYTKSWTPAATGVYNVTARVYYNTTSTLNTPVNKLTVNALPLSAVKITSITATSLNYTNGAGSKFILLKSANVGASLGTWTRMATNTVSPGSFVLPGSEPQMFYSIKSE